MAADQDQVRRAALAELARRELARREEGQGQELGALDMAAMAMPPQMRARAGVAETALQLGSGAVAAPIAGLAGIGAMLPGGKSPADAVRDTQSALTYRPRTAEGQAVSSAAAKPGELIDRVADFSGDKLGGSSPLAETAIKTLILGGGLILGPKVKTAVSRRRGESGAGGDRGATAEAEASTTPARETTLQDIAETPDKKARRLVAEALERDNLTPAEAARRLQELGPNARLADLGENLAGLARASTAKPGPARTAARDFLEERQAGQQMRLIKTTGLGDVRDFKRAFQEYSTNRQSKAAPLYKEAYDAPLDLSTPGMRALLSRPSMQAALKDAAKILKDEGGGGGHVRLIDAAKRSLDDRIGKAIRAGQREKARRLTMLKNELLKEVDAQVPAFGQARQLYAGEAAMRDAAQLGRNMFNKKLDLDDVELQVSAMGQGELGLFQIGAVRGLLDKLEGTANNRNAAGKLIESTRAREVLRIAFPEELFNRLVKAAEAESQFSGTRQTVRGGSPTARILEEGADLERAAGVATSLARGELFGAVQQSLGGVLQRLGIGKVSDKTLAELARLLFDEYKPAAAPAAPLQITSGAPRLTGPAQ